MSSSASRCPAVQTAAPGIRSLLLQPSIDDDPAGFAALLAKVESERGFRCRSYKTRCLQRRIGVRMRATGVHTFGQYTELLDRQPAEYDRLLDALTINVTRLFRNADAWDVVARGVVPGLLSGSGPIRAWSAGTAHGEEAYTIAALLYEQATTRQQNAAAQITVLGTDVDRGALAAAAVGAYDAPAFLEAPDAFRHRYFSPGFPARVAPELRALTCFAHHDLLADRMPAGEFELIVCRNVLIYFDREAQAELFERFHAALVPGGVLFLGKVETLFGCVRACYEPLDHRHRIFRRL